MERFFFLRKLTVYGLIGLYYFACFLFVPFEQFSEEKYPGSWVTIAEKKLGKKLTHSACIIILKVYILVFYVISFRICSTRFLPIGLESLWHLF